MRLELLLTVLATAIAGGALAASLLGMNVQLPDAAQSPPTFWLVTAAVAVAVVWSVRGFLAFAKRRQILVWRKPAPTLSNAKPTARQ